MKFVKGTRICTFEITEGMGEFAINNDEDEGDEGE